MLVITESDTISIIDVVNEIEIKKIRVGNNPGTMLLSLNTLELVVVNTGINTLSIVNLTTQEESGTVTAGNKPSAMLPVNVIN